MKPANLIAESDVYMKIADIKLGVYKVISIAAKNHGQAFSQSLASPSFLRPWTDAAMALGAQMTIMQNLQYTEHLSEPMADLVNILAKDFDYSQLGEDVLRCVRRPRPTYVTNAG